MKDIQYTDSKEVCQTPETEGIMNKNQESTYPDSDEFKKFLNMLKHPEVAEVIFEYVRRCPIEVHHHFNDAKKGELK